MDRRAFLCCVGGGACALTLSGCAAARTRPASATAPPGRPVEEATDTSKWDISVCGLNCARCPTAAKGECQRCRGPADQHWTPDCKFLSCATSKGHRYCFECAEVPCELLQAFAADGYDHHRLTLENLKQMNELGLADWIAQQEKPMFCPGWLL